MYVIPSTIILFSNTMHLDVIQKSEFLFSLTVSLLSKVLMLL